jgi:hypothetical protein
MTWTTDMVQLLLFEMLRELSFREHDIGALGRAYVGEAVSHIYGDRRPAYLRYQVPLLAVCALMARGVQEREMRNELW